MSHSCDGAARSRMNRSPTQLLELDRATVRRGAHVVLDALDLTIPLGRHTAILGANGSGKSTLMQLLTRELHPLAHDDGRAPVRVLGAHLWDVRSLRGQLGIVTQRLHEDLRTVPSLTASAVVAGATLGAIADTSAEDPALHAQALAALQRMQAAHLVARRYATLSAGEARRVLLARALFHAPAALLLDEPSSGLDVVARAHLMTQIGGIARGGTTLVLVTHHLEELIPEISHVVLLRAGRVLADGPRDLVLTDALLSQAFDAPVHIRTDAHGTLALTMAG
ncbi:ATP-binding cassette domain-containing protein [Luteimonas fraxinea]|uniref:ABC transporter ATP-binding protein n=1 Tax=Luteimonas fraxinea TaxID=2901869 RepID=UPI001E4C293C|nr:ATP-binding cassette domain-containing protein [Luteimonas fraxinea]MCD9127009.1 ATP-binding cassette domain-containing protein [Luteimonas fraxinea]UHH08786.1 ATP-binding cassette domain-containing protein [Luteimonas fraxinea]